MYNKSVLELVGNTPVVLVRNIDTGPCELFLKVESCNPGGSIKDRVGLTMIDAAEAAGKLVPGGTIVEASAGNTGIALALVGAQKGYKTIIVVPDKMSREKIAHLRALGAEVVMTRSDVEKGHPEYYQDLAESIAARTPGAYYINQFNNPANSLAHEQSTAPEIWEQLDHRVDAVVCGVGSGGTITGISHYFARVSPTTEMVLADPKGSVLEEYIRTGHLSKAGSWLVEGIGEDFLPPLCDLSRVSKAYTISDQESFETARDLLKMEGHLGGSSTGTLVAAALRYCREQKSAKRVVTFVCDSGVKYLSKMYNDYWMIDQGFIKHEHTGDLSEIISRRFDEGEIVTVSPADTLATAYGRMKLYDISQLPVMKDGRVVGVLDESDLLLAAQTGEGSFSGLVELSMSKNLLTVDRNESLDAVVALLHQGYVALVLDGEEFLGMVTRSDLLSYLRRKGRG